MQVVSMHTAMQDVNTEPTRLDGSTSAPRNPAKCLETRNSLVGSGRLGRLHRPAVTASPVPEAS